MSQTSEAVVPLSNTGRFFIDGEWVKPSSDAVIDVIDSGDRAVVLPSSRSAARGHGPGHRCRTSGVRPGSVATDDTRRAAGYLRAMADKLEARASDYSAMWPRESGVCHAIREGCEPGNPETLRFYADLADDYPFEEPFSPSTTSMAGGGFGLLVREPVGVVGAIIPWNAPLPLILHQGRPGAAGRMHGDRQGVARGSRCWISDGGDRRGGGPPGRRAERHHRRPRGIRAHGA